MNRRDTLLKKTKVILSLLVVTAITLTSTVQALASSGGHIYYNTTLVTLHSLSSKKTELS